MQLAAGLECLVKLLLLETYYLSVKYFLFNLLRKAHLSMKFKNDKEAILSWAPQYLQKKKKLPKV